MKFEWNAKAGTPVQDVISLRPPPTEQETLDEIHRLLEVQYQRPIRRDSYELLALQPGGQAIVRWINKCT